MRRLGVFAIALVCTLLVTAVALGGKPRFEQKRLRPADMALAKRTTLRAGDLGRGWTRRQPERLPNELPNCPGVDVDFSMFTITGTAASAFSRGGATVDSRVEVFESKSDAVRDFRKASSAAVMRCFGRWLRKELERELPGGRVVSARLASRPRIGQQAILYRLVMEIPASSPPPRIYVDVVAFQRGRTAVTLTFGAPASPVRGELGFARSVAARTR